MKEQLLGGKVTKSKSLASWTSKYREDGILLSFFLNENGLVNISFSENIKKAQDCLQS